MWFGVELELRLNESENALYIVQLANGRLYFGPTHHTVHKDCPLSSLILKIPFFISRLNRQVCGQPFGTVRCLVLREETEECERHRRQERTQHNERPKSEADGGSWHHRQEFQEDRKR